MRERRWRTIILVTGTVLCVLVAAVFVVSGWYWIEPRFASTGIGANVALSGGAFLFSIQPRLGYDRWMARHPVEWRSWNRWFAEAEVDLIVVPVYAFFLAVGVPTLLTWRFVSKFPRGHCQRCGYNLTGNVSGRCPECGEAVNT